MKFLFELAPIIKFSSTESFKKTDLLNKIVSEKNLEASAFAWMAYMREQAILVDNSSATGAKKPYLLGNIY